MLAAFKELILPYLVYITVFWACGYSIFKRASTSVYLYLVLVAFPQFWYPTQGFPLGAMTLTLLAVSAMIGAKLQRPPDDPKAPNGTLVIILILSSYFALWITSVRYGLAYPVTGANDLMAAWKNYALMLFLYFVGYYALRTEDNIRKMMMFFFWIIIVMAWREFANFVSGDSFSYNRRSVGSFWIVGMGANHFAAFIAHFSAPAIGLFAVDDNKWRKRFYLITFICSLYPLFFSYSRGAYVAVLFAVLVVGLLRYRILLPLFAIFMLTWDSILPNSVVDRIQMTEGADGQMEESAALRLVVWDLAKRLFAENPTIGIGFQGFYYASAGLPLRNVHNYFLQTAAEQGVFGLILLGVFFLKAAWSGWRLYKNGSSNFLRGTGLGFVACISAVIITNLFGDRFSQLEVGSYLWLMFGAVDRAWVMSRSVEVKPSKPVVVQNKTAIP